jgi:hypothetical protein
LVSFANLNSFHFQPSPREAQASPHQFAQRKVQEAQIKGARHVRLDGKVPHLQVYLITSSWQQHFGHAQKSPAEADHFQSEALKFKLQHHALIPPRP